MGTPLSFRGLVWYGSDNSIGIFEQFGSLLTSMNLFGFRSFFDLLSLFSS
jgi:hypothetical protein